VSHHIAHQRGVLLYRQGRYELAVEEFSRALAEQPNDASAHAMIAMCFAAQERWADAQRQAETAIGLEPDDAFAHYARATALLGRGRLVHASEAIHEALRLDPHDPDAWSLRAIVAYNTGAFAGAADAAARGLAIDPGHIECLRMRARALNQIGDTNHLAGADASMREALTQSPDDAHAHCDAGHVLLERGRPVAAFGFFREALRLDPTLADARTGLLASLRGRHPLYRILLRFFLFTPKANATRRVVGPVLAIGGALVLWKGVKNPAPGGREEIFFGAVFLMFGIAFLLGEAMLNWLIGHRRW
jgi:Flp pilus assembly protein TadD